MFEFANQNGVAQMQIRRSGIEARLDPKGLARLCGLFEARAQFGLADGLYRAFLQVR